MFMKYVLLLVSPMFGASLLWQMLQLLSQDRTFLGFKSKCAEEAVAFTSVAQFDQTMCELFKLFEAFTPSEGGKIIGIPLFGFALPFLFVLMAEGFRKHANGSFFSWTQLFGQLAQMWSVGFTFPAIVIPAFIWNSSKAKTVTEDPFVYSIHRNAILLSSLFAFGFVATYVVMCFADEALFFVSTYAFNLFPTLFATVFFVPRLFITTAGGASGTTNKDKLNHGISSSQLYRMVVMLFGGASFSSYWVVVLYFATTYGINVSTLSYLDIMVWTGNTVNSFLVLDFAYMYVSTAIFVYLLSGFFGTLDFIALTPFLSPGGAFAYIVYYREVKLETEMIASAIRNIQAETAKKDE